MPTELITGYCLYNLSRGTVVYNGKIICGGDHWGADCVLERVELRARPARALSYVEVSCIDREALLAITYRETNGAYEFPSAARKSKWEAVRLGLIRTLLMSDLPPGSVFSPSVKNGDRSMWSSAFKNMGHESMSTEDMQVTPAVPCADACDARVPRTLAPALSLDLASLESRFSSLTPTLAPQPCRSPRAQAQHAVEAASRAKSKRGSLTSSLTRKASMTNIKPGDVVGTSASGAPLSPAGVTPSPKNPKSLKSLLERAIGKQPTTASVSLPAASNRAANGFVAAAAQLKGAPPPVHVPAEDSAEAVDFLPSMPSVAPSVTSASAAAPPSTKEPTQELTQDAAPTLVPNRSASSGSIGGGAVSAGRVRTRSRRQPSSTTNGGGSLDGDSTFLAAPAAPMSAAAFQRQQSTAAALFAEQQQQEAVNFVAAQLSGAMAEVQQQRAAVQQGMQQGGGGSGHGSGPLPFATAAPMPTPTVLPPPSSGWVAADDSAVGAATNSPTRPRSLSRGASALPSSGFFGGPPASRGLGAGPSADPRTMDADDLPSDFSGI